MINEALRIKNEREKANEIKLQKKSRAKNQNISYNGVNQRESNSYINVNANKNLKNQYNTDDIDMDGNSLDNSPAPNIEIDAKQVKVTAKNKAVINDDIVENKLNNESKNNEDENINNDAINNDISNYTNAEQPLTLNNNVT